MKKKNVFPVKNKKLITFPSPFLPFPGDSLVQNSILEKNDDKL